MSLNRRTIAVGTAITWWLWSGVTAWAHQPGLSTLFVDVGSNRVNAQLIVAWQELEASSPLDTNRDRTLSTEELAAARPRLLRLGESAFSFESDGRMLSLKAPPDIQIDDTTGIRDFQAHQGRQPAVSATCGVDEARRSVRGDGGRWIPVVAGSVGAVRHHPVGRLVVQ